MNAIDIVFEWLLAATLRASVLAVAILGIQLVLRRWLPAGWRHALWLPMLAVLVLPVLPTAPFGLFPLAEKNRIAATAIPNVATVEGQANERNAALMKTGAAATRVNYLALVWLAGACGVFVAGVAGYRRNMARVKREAICPDGELVSVIGSAAREAGLEHAPRVLISPAVESPAVTGLWRPVLLLPSGFPEGFNAAETRLILLHEFSHLKRLDLPLNWLSCVLQAMHWFNPLLWFAFARMRADREAACDARVLSIDQTDRRAEYGGALLKLQCVARSRVLSLGFVGIFERGSEMKSRIREISRHRPGNFAWQAAGGAILTLLMMFGVTKAVEAGQAKPTGEAAKSIPPAAGPVQSSGAAYITNKLEAIVIPSIDFQDVSIGEAVDFLRLRSTQLDSREQDPSKKGINFAIRRPRAGANGVQGKDIAVRRLTLKLKNVSLKTALSEVVKRTGCAYKVDDFAVTLITGEEAAQARVIETPAVETKKTAGKAVEVANQMVIPKVEFEDTSLQEAVDFLNLQARELSKGDPGFTLTIDTAVDATKRIRKLRLKNVPLAIAAKYCADQARLALSASDKEIRFSKHGADSP